MNRLTLRLNEALFESHYYSSDWTERHTFRSVIAAEDGGQGCFDFTGTASMSVASLLSSLHS